MATFMLIACRVSAGDVSIAVTNSGFEQVETASSVAGWHLDPEASRGDISVLADTDVAYSGAASLAISCGSPCTAVVVSKPLALQVGHLYRLSGWIRPRGVKSDPTSKYPTAVPACLSMESFPFTNHSSAVGGDADWTRVETLFVATTGRDRVRLHLGHNGTASGRVWFDDIQVEKVENIDAYIPMETVRWFDDGYRYDDRGWIFVHIEGEPYQRGYQFGALVADEIVAYITKLAIKRNAADPAAAWRTLRFEADTLFLRGYDPEYLTEMKGIADGADHAKATYDGRPIDLLDIVTINSVVDLGQLRRACGVTPHALTGESFLEAEEEMNISEEDHKCSAFVATGPATVDGQVVFGQIFMWGGYTGVHWNVICDVQPAAGHRLVYQTFPGGIHSGADFYINSAGIVIGETTVSQTPYEPDSTPQSNRIRKAAQYASSIDDVERILWQGNNGMYTNDWPIADVKTGEVAILLLGTHAKRMWRTGEDMSPFGTPGFLWANNNNRDPEVRKEYQAQPDDRPFDLAFSPWNRDVAFNEFYRKNKGRIDSTAAVRLWASSPVNRAHACDGKITTTEMARELVFLAHHGKVTLREKFPQRGYRIMPDLAGAIPHLSLGYSVPSPIVITAKLKEARDAGRWSQPEDREDTDLELGDLSTDFNIDHDRLWRRTVYPATSAENWFVSASAAYWKLLAGLDEDDAEVAADELSDELAALTRRYLYTVSRETDLKPVAATWVYDRYGPYRIPRIKGTFALHQLRLLIGTEVFLELMRTIHDRHAEREMTNEQCMAIIREVAGASAVPLVRQWIERQGLPRLRPSVHVRKEGEDNWGVRFTVAQDGKPYRLITHVMVETGDARHVRRVEIDGASTEIMFSFDTQPSRIEFNALDDIPVASANYYVWRNLLDDFHDTLIVYATARQDEANHTLARRWQETVANAYIEILPPLVKDSELTYEQAANHDLILMGTLNDNRWIQDLQLDLPVRFGRNHFEWRGVTYGDSDDGLFLVAPNPYNTNRVVYVVAANSALELHQMTKRYTRNLPSWALFKGDEVVEQGYHSVQEFQFEGPFEPF